MSYYKLDGRGELERIYVAVDKLVRLRGASSSSPLHLHITYASRARCLRILASLKEHIDKKRLVVTWPGDDEEDGDDDDPIKRIVSNIINFLKELETAETQMYVARLPKQSKGYVYKQAKAVYSFSPRRKDRGYCYKHV